jgi:hypothetical protein
MKLIELSLRIMAEVSDDTTSNHVGVNIPLSALALIAYQEERVDAGSAVLIRKVGHERVHATFVSVETTEVNIL